MPLNQLGLISLLKIISGLFCFFPIFSKLVGLLVT